VENAENPFQALLDLLQRLNKARISHSMQSVREDAIMVSVVVPGERWEIEVFANGEIEVEVFRGGGEIQDGSAIEELLRRFDG